MAAKGSRAVRVGIGRGGTEPPYDEDDEESGNFNIIKKT